MDILNEQHKKLSNNQSIKKTIRTGEDSNGKSDINKFPSPNVMYC